jgi:uncharacterized protein (TIGR02147 family)
MASVSAREVKIFRYDNYKNFVGDWIKTKPHNGRGQYKRLATYIRLHTTQVSQIFQGERHLSSEHAVTLAAFLGLNDLERDYLMTLVQHARSGSIELTRLLSARLQVLRERQDSVSQRVSGAVNLSEADKARLYSNWYGVAIRLATSLPTCQSSDDVAALLEISKDVVERELMFLLESGLVTSDTKGLAIGPVRTHVGPDSPFVALHHRNWRLKTLSRIDSVRRDELAFTAPVSLSKKDIGTIRQVLLDAIEKCSSIVQESPPETLAVLNIDWFQL